MKLSLSGLKDRAFWEANNYCLPSFDIEKLKQNTLLEPIWLHFGAGNIFRMFPAFMQQQLIENNLSDKGIIVCETYDEEIIDKSFAPYDNLSIAVTLPAKGEIQKTVVASIVHSIKLSENFNELVEIFKKESLQIASFTITEKAYALRGTNGELLPFIAADSENRPEEAKSVMGVIAYLLYMRFKSGKYPITLLSMDNCSHNGDKIFEAVSFFAGRWEKKGFTDKGFCDYIKDKNKVSCPISMIDKITPRPSETVKSALTKDGIEDVNIVCTAKGTYVAPFVNAEETQYFIVEDLFPNGRPPLEKAGTIFTKRDTVDKVEKMKVCTCLNPLHTILAVFGCLMGYKTIAEEMKDELLAAFVKRAGHDEGMPVVIDPGIIDPVKFLDEVINIRFPNPHVPDTPQRIACDTSQKIPVRFGETLKAYINKGTPVSGLTYIPLFFAGWLRYLTGIGDDGKPFELNQDPMLEILTGYVKDIKLGDTDIAAKVKPILSDKNIFGVNLYEHGLGEKVEALFIEMLKEPGAIRKTLKRVIA